MKKVKIQIQGNKILIGESPKLMVDINGGGNYIETSTQIIPYYKTIQLSRDLLDGKRENVFETAISYYYKQACDVVEGYQIASEHRGKVNVHSKEVDRN